MIHSEAVLFYSCAWISDQEAAVRSMTHRWIERGINAFREKCDMKLTLLDMFYYLYGFGQLKWGGSDAGIIEL